MLGGQPGRERQRLPGPQPPLPPPPHFKSRTFLREVAKAGACRPSPLPLTQTGAVGGIKRSPCQVMDRGSAGLFLRSSALYSQLSEAR